MVVLGMHPAKTCTPARSLVFAWRHAAHASRPLRPRAAILAAALALACGRQASQQAPLETVRGVPIHAAVVAHIAARDGVDEATALERARQTARLAHDFDRKAGLPGHAIPPARIAQLRRRALARLWLTEAFEPAHRAEDIPRQALEQGLEDVRVFHPRLHFVCQAIVIPDLPRVDGQPIPEFPDDPATRAQAVAYGDRLAARMVRYVSAPEHESDCKWIEHVTRQSTPPPRGFAPTRRGRRLRRLPRGPVRRRLRRRDLPA